MAPELFQTEVGVAWGLVPSHCPLLALDGPWDMTKAKDGPRGQQPALPAAGTSSPPPRARMVAFLPVTGRSGFRAVGWRTGPGTLRTASGLRPARRHPV